MPVLKKLVAKAKSSISSNKLYGASVQSKYLNIDNNIDDIYSDYLDGEFTLVWGDDWDYVNGLIKSDSKYSQYKNEPGDLLDTMYGDRHSQMFVKQATVFDDMRKALPSGWTITHDGDKTEWNFGIKRGEPNKYDMESIKWFEKTLKK